MSEDFDGDEYEDDDDFSMLVECKPITKYTFVHYGISIVVGCLRSVLEATCDLGNAVTGAEYHAQNKREFEDEARLAIESITSTDTEE